MNDTTLKYKAKIAIRNYTLVFILLAVVATVSQFLGNTTELMLLKLAVVPLYFLSTGGLRSIYRYPIVEHKITPRAVEYVVLEGLIMVLFIFIVIWDPEATTPELLKHLGFTFMSLTVLKLIYLFCDVKRIAKDRESQS